LVFWRVEYLNEKAFRVIKKHLAIRAISLCQIIAIKGDNITFPFEGHYSKIVEGKHVRHNFMTSIQNSMPPGLTVENVD
jgi:hypothetical protein